MTIAIIAHDGRKADMVGFIKDHIDLFQRRNIRLIATGTTGEHLERAGLQVEKMRSGPMGVTRRSPAALWRDRSTW